MRYLFILFIFISASNLFAQKIETEGSSGTSIPFIAAQKELDVERIRLQYKQSILIETTVPKKYQESMMVLEIGQSISKYFDLKTFLSDSILIQAEKEKPRDRTAVRNKVLSLRNGSIPMHVFKNYPTRKYTVIDRIPFDDYMYEENIEVPKWKLSSEMAMVCGYSCKKATTTFRGRNYTAWYTSQIPISDGPWKFSGLPGIILKATDDKEEITFECVSIRKINYISPIYILQKTKYVRTSKKRYHDMVKKFMDNPGAHFSASGMIKGDLPSSTNRKRAYNPIELSY